MEITGQDVFSKGFAEHLASFYDPNDVQQLSSARFVDVPYLEGEQITYSRINEGHGHPILIVAGFTESITSLSPLALELTQNKDGSKSDVLIVDQQQVGSYIDPTKLNEKGRPTQNEAIDMQALNYLAVLEKENPAGPIRIVAHSFGALITQKMVELAKRKAEANGTPSILEGADIVFVAPAGSHEKESLIRLGARFAVHSITENFSPKTFHDKNGEMLRKGIANIKANKRRTWQEIRALASERVDYQGLKSSGIGSLAVMAFAKDRLFPQRVLKRSMKKALAAGVSYMTPVLITQESVEVERAYIEEARALGYSDNKAIDQFVRTRYRKHKPGQASRGSSHNDISFTPSRAANAIKEHFSLVA